MEYPFITNGPTAEVTPSGTPYNRLYYNETGDEVVMMAVPTAAETASSITLVIACHGYGGSYQSWNDHPPFLELRDGLNDIGFVVAAPNMHGNQWGSQTVMDDLRRVYDYAASLWTVEGVILVGGSMGGLTVLNTLARNVIPDVVALVAVAPVVSLAAAHALSGYRTSIRAAYGVASDGSDFAAKTSGFDPLEQPQGTWQADAVSLYHSADDTAITLAANSQAFVNAGKSALMRYFRLTVTAGAHLDAANFDIPATLAFIASAVAGTLPKQTSIRTPTFRVWDGFTYRAIVPKVFIEGAWRDAPATAYV